MATRTDTLSSSSSATSMPSGSQATGSSSAGFPTSTPSSSSDWDTASDLGGSAVSGLDEAGMPRGDAGLGGGTHSRGNDMLQRVVQGAHQTIDRLADTAAPHVQRLSENLDHKSGQVRDMSDEWTDSLRTTVRENPIAAVATALALGMLISRLTR